MLGASALGICPIHRIDLMAIGMDDTNLTPTCIKCKSDSEPKSGRVQTVEDPGEEFFKGKGSNAKITVLENAHGTKSAVVGHPAFSEAPRLEDIVGVAVANLKRLPMPEDIKQFKAVQKVIKTLESLLEKSNG